MIPNIDAMIATTPKNGVWTFPRFSKKIKKEPENIPMTEPISPITISKFLDTDLVLFMFNNMYYNIIYRFTNRQLPEV